MSTGRGPPEQNLWPAVLTSAASQGGQLRQRGSWRLLPKFVRWLLNFASKVFEEGSVGWGSIPPSPQQKFRKDVGSCCANLLCRLGKLRMAQFLTLSNMNFVLQGLAIAMYSSPERVILVLCVPGDVGNF